MSTIPVKEETLTKVVDAYDIVTKKLLEKDNYTVEDYGQCMEASLNIVAALKQDDLHSHSKASSSGTSSTTGQIQASTKKSTCQKINQSKKTFKEKLSKTLTEGETKSYKGKMMQAVFTSFKAANMTGMVDKFNITTYKTGSGAGGGGRLLEEGSGEK